ncbi:E3 ubiquitin/ISG15 ligase TRIM25 [Pangasianodon hypophthalmus]|uniref:E3 ubiquitin/ISG15 ligase TRIM25 n=1 Tax=Pangasianodon hypophthalmus TaxID=310915 RepID=UPI002307D52C|nr:E3 ubiquitin/ISG15 ligase TRIM25 [Pangasianodon hypophthalmus]
MAEASISVDQDQFICPVCLDLLSDPVTTPCGHCFCKVCINGCWDQEDVKGVYSCPQCRETFTPRPVLRRNNMLAEVVEKLKKTEHQAASPAHCYAGPGDVKCDFCTGRKHKAVKTCLVCQASYCEDHLKPHYQSPAFKKHKLVEACAELQEKICSEHNKLIEIYCRTDQSFICYLCTMDKHKGHNTLSTKAERTEKQNELKEEQMKSQQRIQEKQKKVQELKQALDTIKKRSQAAVDDSEKIFTELISSMERKRSEVKKLIRAQEEAELSRAERLLKQLEQEIADHKRRVTELEQLSHTHDHIHFLQSFPSLCVSPGCVETSNFTVNQHLSFDGVRKSLSDLKTQLEEICEEEFHKIHPQAAAVRVILPSELKSREDFLQYFCYLTLNPNTANRQLSLSEQNRLVTRSRTQQQYCDHPERFDSWTQVLCKESVCGRCYWEVEWSSDVDISVSYKEISRKGGGNNCVFGCNSQSWSLRCSSSSVSFRHNDIKTELRGPASSRIGVYVDHSAGTLSFYSVSDTMRLLHTVHTTFTQPLYPGFWLLNFNSTVKLFNPKLSHSHTHTLSHTHRHRVCACRKMAEASISVDQLSVDQFSCPVCLDLLKHPVTTPCGHSFCKVCINHFWDEEDQKRVYSCPQCRETFTPRPVLRRNNMLAEVVEKLKKTEHQAASPAHWYTGPGDVECDFCTGRKRKALKTCLVCLASYCEDHLQPHYQSPAFKKHKLVEACAELQEKICSEHDKLMEIYCRTDQSFICYLCTMDQHKGHDTVSTKAERTEKQNEVKEEQMKSQQRIQEKQKKVQELKHAVDTIKKRSQAAVDDSERIFTELISSMEKKRSEVKKLIRAQEEAELSRAERLLKQLEQEIADHKRRVTELEQLSHTHDHIHFLQSFPSLCVPPGCEVSPSITVNQHLSFDGVRKSLSDLKKQFEEICEKEFNKIHQQAAAVQMISPSEPKSREDFLQYFCYLTLDPNTAHRQLILSEENKAVTLSSTRQQYSDHPERFEYRPQVLSKESVCGRCYWEVEWSGAVGVTISVSYKEISRKGQRYECEFGLNSLSWSLGCFFHSFFFQHNETKTELRGPASSRIGVYVDHSAGTLSFYNISDTMRLLHRVHTTFTQPLYAGFRIVHYDSIIRLCDPK